MGGHAFEKLGISTPRISTHVYKDLASKYLEVLASFFQRVTCSHEPPNKDSHGDVDLLVEGPHLGVSSEHLAEVLDAKVHVTNGTVTSYAVLHPDDPSAYVQLDVQVCREGFLEWQQFMTSYGDVSQILGVVHRSLGLSSTDKGLHVRIPEMEAKNRKASMVYLSHDPEEVMKFLGLNPSLFHSGFDSEAEIYRWIASGRFFNRNALETHGHHPPEENSNDRTRRMKRGMYRRFVEGWMMDNPHAGSDCHWDRDSVLLEAIKNFAREEEYQTKLRKYQDVAREEALWAKIKMTIPRKNDSLRLVVRGLKRWIEVKNGRPIVRNKALPGKEFQPWSSKIDERSQLGLLDWIRDNWVIVQTKEKGFIKRAVCV
ncbi:uncharacterized protein K452DRAFT_253107 [Aplosporella prunicola CBS 121167]|uniref:Uncharacterized protein n=1 Tax=Aplosporella prunicola CBS 121167 TaxID=1176127 RepID=A0A6A6BCW4_9PEZI|nr:uncharacterized protein K452DRAFT_253107 [Aplosporella prunicola CBS 121167]KAF2140331.1 hypothetical protein K452DRAFT_253107 [Aplosporella prunicola CBS 121167]